MNSEAEHPQGDAQSTPAEEPQVTPQVTPAVVPADDAPQVDPTPQVDPEPTGALVSEPSASAAGPPNQGIEPEALPTATDEPSEAGTAEPPPPSLSAEELAEIREILVSANPQAVPELIQGSTLAELKASVEGAKAAYQRIADSVHGTPPAPVPAGQPGRQAEVLPEDATPEQRIAAGLRARKVS